MSNASLAVFNNSDGISCVNLTALLKVDIARPAFFVTVSIRREGSHEYKLYFKGQFDLCRMQNGTFGGLVMYMVALNFLKYSNFRFDCIQKKRFIYASNFPAFDIKYLTIFSRKSEDRTPEFEFSFAAKVKVKNRKLPDNIVSAKIYGQIIL